MLSEPLLSDFPVQTSEKVRYADTDRQGHVNNAIFATFLETGRVEALYNPRAILVDAGGEFVIARLILNFRAEIHWPGTVMIGTRVASIGKSSVQLEQALFQNDRCAAFAETSIVQIDTESRRAKPLSAIALERFANLQHRR